MTILICSSISKISDDWVSRGEYSDESLILLSNSPFCVDISAAFLISDSLTTSVKLDNKSVITSGSLSVICDCKVELSSKLLDVIWDSLLSIIVLSIFICGCIVG